MADEPRLGLRERKKARTRQAIRREAFRLFEADGYANTTVEQIAAAAEVSPSTFFRYFRSKDEVLHGDDVSDPIVAMLATLPESLTPAEAIRQALEHGMQNVPEDQWEAEETRQRLLLSDPDLHPVLLANHWRVIVNLGAGIAARLGRDPDEFEIRVFAGALAGAMLGGMGRAPISRDNVLRAYDFLQCGMPLTQQPFCSC